MTDPIYVPLAGRGTLVLEGEDRAAFLQGLVTNDVQRVGPHRALYAAFLTAQGKYRHDFFIAEHPRGWLIDAEAARREDLLKGLRIYKLRSKVALADATDAFDVVALPGAAALGALGLPADPGAARPLGGGVVFVDPRLPEMGARAFLPRGQAASTLEPLGFRPGSPESYEELRLSLGLPDGSRDLEVERALLLENNFDEMHAVDWKKGCYIGQELTARTKYRALVRKRLLPVAVEGPLPAPGTRVLRDGKEVGEIRSGHGSRALALLRLEDVADAAPGALEAGAARLTLRPLPWGTAGAPQDQTAPTPG